ncbi:MAG: carboxypeptidase regulatory-like domain-containing protein [Candidatus Marithrix sp.]
MEIFGPGDWVMDLEGLVEGAVSANKTIILAVGKGGVIDLRGVSSKVFKAAEKIEIFSDHILLDEGVTFADLADAPIINVEPAKILYRMALSGEQHIVGEAGTTVTINFSILNNGPTEDTYTLTLGNSAKWSTSNLPSTIKVDSLKKKSLSFDVTLPQESGENIFTITATSQSDLETSKILGIRTISEGGIAVPSEYNTTGTIKDVTGNPIAKVTVTIGDKIVTTDVNGNWEILGLIDGNYTITAKIDDYAIVPKDFVVNGKNVVLDLEAILVSKGNYRTSGTIRDDVGNPIIGITLQIGDQTVITDAAGNWEIGNLPEGEYTITATKDGLTFMPVDFEVGNNQTLTQIKLKPLTDLKARIATKVRGQKAEQGKPITYVIRVVNGGNKTATDGIVNYQIPTGTELVDIQGMGEVVCNGTVCTLPNLPIGASANIEVVLNIGEIANTITNVVTLTSNEFTTDVAKTWTKAKPYLSVFGTANPKPVTMGSQLHYSFAVELNDNAPNGETTGTKLTVTLPKELNFESAPDNCDTTNLPVVVCSVDNLNVENPDDTSKVTINIDTLVKEPGLIKLIAKAEVTSDKYAAHSSKVRVEVDTQGVEVDGVIVIDVTHSMSSQLNSVINEVKKRIIEGFANDAKPLIAILSFRDEDDIKLVAATRDMETLLTAVENLEAKDGGMCPEASADALLLGLSHLKQKGTLIFITDAPSYDDAETRVTLEQIKQILDDKEINSIPIITEVNCDGEN